MIRTSTPSVASILPEAFLTASSASGFAYPSEIIAIIASVVTAIFFVSVDDLEPGRILLIVSFSSNIILSAVFLPIPLIRCKDFGSLSTTYLSN